MTSSHAIGKTENAPLPADLELELEIASLALEIEMWGSALERLRA